MNKQARAVTAQVEDLARLSFKRKPVYVGVDDQRQEATREGLEQGYCVVPSEQRFLLLFTFLKRNAAKKVCRWPSSPVGVCAHGPEQWCCVVLPEQSCYFSRATLISRCADLVSC